MHQAGSGFVFMVESPSGNDLLYGRTEGKTLFEALKLSGTPGWYSLVTDKETFYTALRERIFDALRAFPNEPPILHFSMHGSTEGLALTNGEFISWFELKTALAPLNNALPNGLLICMSSCFGISGQRMAMHTDADKPFWALVGNCESAQWSDAAVAFVTFYHRLFKGAALDTAVSAMRIASGDDNFMIYEGAKVRQAWFEYLEKTRPQNLLEALLATEIVNQ